mgnify:FL=1
METLQRAINRGNVPTGFDVTNSLKFEPDNSEYLQWTNIDAYATSARKKTFSFSVWFKITELGAQRTIWSTAANGYLLLQADGELKWQQSYNSVVKVLQTNRVLRDTNAWYNVIVAVDTTQSTEANRQRLYINGVEETSFSTGTYPSQNDEADNVYQSFHSLGAYNASSIFFAGYMAEVAFVSDSQITPTDVGEFDADSGIWKPKKYSGGSAPSYFLQFKDSSDLGSATGLDADTLNNIGATDQTIDTCTNNFCTFNILVHTDNKPTISEGAMKVVGGGGNWNNAYGSMGVQRGKWYYEYKVDNTEIGGHGWSTFPDTSDDATSTQFLFDQSAVLQGAGTHYYQKINGTQISNESTGFGTSAVNDIFGVFLNADDQEITWAKNGSVLSGSLSQPISLNAAFSGHFIFPCNVQFENDGGQYNFGAYTLISNTRSFSDADGQGKFVYSPVLSGVNYFALCSKNLAEYG